MALFLAVLGGAAVAEVHRAITGGNKDVSILRHKEESLRKQLQEVQRELQQAQSQRELTAQEAAQLAIINAQLQQAKDDLEKESSALKLEKEELEARTKRLIEREQILEQCTESLKLENSILIHQFEKLKVKHEQETAAFTEQLQTLKDRVATTLHHFTTGQMNAHQLVESLAEFGVTLECSEDDMARLEKVAAVTATEEQRTEALETVELKVEDTWMNHMRLVSSSQALASKLLMQGAVRGAAIAEATTAAAAAAETARSLVTPRILEATEHKAAALKLTSHVVTEEEVSQEEDKGMIRAVHAAIEEEREVAAVEVPQAAVPQAPSSRSLVFRPIKRAVSKAIKSKQPLVEMDVPVPRLSLDNLSEGPTANSLMATTM